MEFGRLLITLLLGLSILTVSQPVFAGPPLKLRVVSYNIKLGWALKKERSLPKALRKPLSIAHLLSNHKSLKNFDILGTQEHCSNEGGWQLDYFRNFLRERDGRVWAVTGREDPDTTFLCERVAGIFSRYPIVASGLLKLPFLHQARSVTWADIVIPAADGNPPRAIRVYNGHFDTEGRKGQTGEEGRLLQARAVLDHIFEWRKTNPDTPVIFMGDLNSLGKIWDFLRREAGVLELSKYLNPSLTRYHHTYVVLPNQLDWIFYDRLDLIRSKVVQVFLSDHLPIVADFELN
jgi:endonuclease/exonuclease/phosphatase family metal-dependent hydrolase